MPIPLPEAIFNADTDRVELGSHVFVRVDPLIEIAKAVDKFIREATGNTTDPVLLAKGEGALEFSREFRFQLARLNKAPDA